MTPCRKAFSALLAVRNQGAFLDLPKYVRDAVDLAMHEEIECPEVTEEMLDAADKSFARTVQPPVTDFGTPQRRADDGVLFEALGLLHRFATENVGWRSIGRRWYYNDEPLRHDAANLVRRAQYQAPMPEHCQLVGEGRS